MQELNRISKRLVVFLCIASIITTSTVIFAAAPPAKPAQSNASAPLFREKPVGWILTQAGECDTLTLFLRNPAEPLQQLFFFPRFGPVYISQEQKAADLQNEALGGQRSILVDIPVIQPLTPENFSRFLPQILQMKTMREFIPDRPGLRIAEPIAVKPQKQALRYLDTQTAIIRILFVQDNRLGEGILAITTVPSPELRNMPASGIGMGYMLYGLTAPKGELTAKLPALLTAGRSFMLGSEYERKCRNDRQHEERPEELPALLPEGQSLRPVLDAMSLIWEKRLPTEDMLAEKKSDQLRGVERLYLPATGDVYEFPFGFGAEYLSHPERYNLTDLRPLPDDPTFWLKIPLDGSKSVSKK